MSLFDDGAAPQVNHSRKRSCLRSTRSKCGRRCTGSTPTPHRCSLTRSAAHRSSRTATCSSAGATHPGSPSTPPAARSYSTRTCRTAGRTTASLKMPWHGRPTEPPAIATRRRGGHGLVYASWNGATDVHSWRLESGASPSALPTVSATRRTGFETELLAPAGARYAAVVALDGRSPARPLAGHEDRLVA